MSFERLTQIGITTEVIRGRLGDLLDEKEVDALMGQDEFVHNVYALCSQMPGEDARSILDSVLAQIRPDLRDRIKETATPVEVQKITTRIEPHHLQATMAPDDPLATPEHAEDPALILLCYIVEGILNNPRRENKDIKRALADARQQAGSFAKKKNKQKSITAWCEARGVVPISAAEASAEIIKLYPKAA